MIKPIVLTNGLILVSVPKDAEDFWINNCGCIRYLEDNGKISSVIEPIEMGIYAEILKHQIVGEITKDECDFDCSEYVEKTYKISNLAWYQDYMENYKTFSFHRAIDSFKSMIEAETDFLFENPIQKPNIDAIYADNNPYTSAERRWKEFEERVIEKLVVLKEVK